MKCFQASFVFATLFKAAILESLGPEIRPLSNEEKKIKKYSDKLIISITSLHALVVITCRDCGRYKIKRSHDMNLVITKWVD